MFGKMFQEIEELERKAREKASEEALNRAHRIAILAGFGHMNVAVAKTPLFFRDDIFETKPEFIVEREALMDKYHEDMKALAKKHFGDANVLTTDDVVDMQNIMRKAAFDHFGLPVPEDETDVRESRPAFPNGLDDIEDMPAPAKPNGKSHSPWNGN